MSLFWFVVVPTLLVGAGVSFFWSLRRLGFFSRRVRELVEVHKEFKEVHIDEFEMLVSAEADNLVNYEWRLTQRERRLAAAERIKRARGFLRKMAVNGALCLEVARFLIGKIEKETGNRLLERNHLATRLCDRAAMCQFMAAVCLARTYLLEFCMIAWPFYVPDFGGRFEVRGYDLAAWYEHMVEDVLEVASEDERHWLYENTLFMLAGLVVMPEE
ncbi:MAG TPA: hypothetical protein VI636_24315 [Candidatus Angelobacter sp.]